MNLSVLVQVPLGDQEDLQQLVENSVSEGGVTESRPFDGATVVQALLVLSSSTYPFFRTWITSRSQKTKNTYVSVDGMRLKGFTATEVKRIIQQIEERLKDDDPNLGR